MDEINKARRTAAFFEVYKLVETDGGWKLRGLIYLLSGKPESYSAKDRDNAEPVIRHYSDIGILVKKDFVKLNDFLEGYYSVVLRLWKKVEDYVAYERLRRKDPNWATGFEWLAQQAEIFRLKHYPDTSIDHPRPRKPSVKKTH